MKKVFSIALLLVMIVAVGALATPTASAKRPPSGGGPGECLCPDVFDPVFCTSNGQSYSNFCQAGCAGATGCTRTGDI